MTATTMADPFARSIEAIDLELHEQVERRTKGIDEILHGIFLTERAELVIARLIDERLRATEAAKAEAKEQRKAKAKA
jgi:hypothetical protein